MIAEQVVTDEEGIGAGELAADERVATISAAALKVPSVAPKVDPSHRGGVVRRGPVQLSGKQAVVFHADHTGAQ